MNRCKWLVLVLSFAALTFTGCVNRPLGGCQGGACGTSYPAVQTPSFAQQQAQQQQLTPPSPRYAEAPIQGSMTR